MDEDFESSTDVPAIDLSLLCQDPHSRSLVIEKIGEACHKCGLFQVINHGIHESVIEDALNVNKRFFEMPVAEKEELISNDVFKEVRFAQVNVGDYSREFLKFYAHPLEDFISKWPNLPNDYREKMEIFSAEARKLCIELFGAIIESLNLDETHLNRDFKQGTQILGINCYHPCSESSKIGIPAHTDHSIITLLLQSAPGLDYIDRSKGQRLWKRVPELKGSLQVLVGDHLEVISYEAWGRQLGVASPY